MGVGDGVRRGQAHAGACRVAMAGCPYYSTAYAASWTQSRGQKMVGGGRGFRQGQISKMQGITFRLGKAGAWHIISRELQMAFGCVLGVFCCTRMAGKVRGRHCASAWFGSAGGASGRWAAAPFCKLSVALARGAPGAAGEVGAEHEAGLAGEALLASRAGDAPARRESRHAGRGREWSVPQVPLRFAKLSTQSSGKAAVVCTPYSDPQASHLCRASHPPYPPQPARLIAMLTFRSWARSRAARTGSGWLPTGTGSRACRSGTPCCPGTQRSSAEAGGSQRG